MGVYILYVKSRGHLKDILFSSKKCCIGKLPSTASVLNFFLSIRDKE